MQAAMSILDDLDALIIWLSGQGMQKLWHHTSLLPYPASRKADLAQLADLVEIHAAELDCRRAT